MGERPPSWDMVRCEVGELSQRDRRGGRGRKAG
jgi:hypothetical protein